MRFILILFLTSLFSFTGLANAESTNVKYSEAKDEYAMVFFFRSDCPWCHRFAPKLKSFTDRNNLFTYAFSIDGRGIEGFEIPITSTKEVSAMFFETPTSITVPATFLINVNSQKFARVSIGDVTEESLERTVSNILNDKSIVEALR